MLLSSGFHMQRLEGCLLVCSKFNNMSLWVPLKWQNLQVVMEASKEN